jgi:hypothetical protein
MKLPSGVTLLAGDALATLRTLPDESVHCIVGGDVAGAFTHAEGIASAGRFGFKLMARRR